MKNLFMLIIAPLLAASLCVHAVERRTVNTTLESSWPSRNFSSAMSAPKAIDANPVTDIDMKKRLIRRLRRFAQIFDAFV